LNSVVALGGLAVSAFLSATILPGSSELVLAALAAEGHQHFVVLLVVATVANTLGSATNWWLGGQAERFSQRRWFPATPDQLATAQNWFQRYGKWSLLLSPLPVMGDALTLTAGVMRMNFLQFLLIVGCAKAARYMVVLMGVAAIF
jgi:membrane protein YqaA with SNARE-associated domain